MPLLPEDAQEVFNFGPVVTESWDDVDWKLEHPFVQFAQQGLLVQEIKYPYCAYRDESSLPKHVQELRHGFLFTLMMVDAFDDLRARYPGLPINLKKKPFINMVFKWGQPPWNRRMRQWYQEQRELSDKFQKKMLIKLYLGKSEAETGPLPKTEEEFRVCFEKYKALLVV